MRAYPTRHSGRHHAHPAQQRGAAILLAMLVMVMVTTVVAGTLWRQSQLMEMEAAERDRAQANWVLNGLLDWARIIIREDDRPNSGNPNPRRVDYLDEPWAKELKASSLSSFLALDKNDNGGRDESNLTKAYFSGRIEDENSKFNLPDLLSDDLSGFDPNYGPVFDRLCGLLSIPDAERDAFKASYLRAARLSAGLSADSLPPAVAQMLQSNTGTSATPPAVDTLLPHTLEQLDWLGASSGTVDKLRPYLVIFNPYPITQPHPRQSININTADPIMLKAAIVGCDDNCAQQIRQMSLSNAIKGFSDANALFAQSAFAPLQAQNANAPIDGKSQLFKVMGRLQIENLQVEESALLWRPSPGDVRVYQRERSTLGNFINDSDKNAVTADDLASSDSNH